MERRKEGKEEERRRKDRRRGRGSVWEASRGDEEEAGERRDGEG